MNATRPHAVGEYLRRLQRSMGDLPAARRDEIVAEIEEHIAEVLAEEGPTPTEAAVRNALERVGDPADIAAEAREGLGIAPARPRWTDVAAIPLLLVGGFIPPVLGWIVGVVLLWISDVWSTRDKIIGTLVVPGGLALPLGLTFIASNAPVSCEVAPGTNEFGPCVAATSSTMAGALEWIVLVFLVIAPIVVAVHLARKLRRARLAND
jgi:uncharacterized membrane protein